MMFGRCGGVIVQQKSPSVGLFMFACTFTTRSVRATRFLDDSMQVNNIKVNLTRVVMLRVASVC